MVLKVECELLNVLLITPTLSGGGSERVLINAAEAFVKSGHQVYVICIQNLVEYHCIDSHIHVHHLNLPKKIGKQKWVVDYFLGEKFRQIESKFGPIHFILSNYATHRRFLPKSHLNRIYYWLHFDYNIPIKKMAMTDPQKAQGTAKQLKACYDGKRVITPSEGAKQTLLTLIKAKPSGIFKIHHPFDIEKIQILSGKKNQNIPKEPYILHCGRFDLHSKRQDRLFRTYKLLTDPPKLVLLTKNEPKLQELIQQFDLTDQLIVAGFQQNPYPWFKQAQLTVLCSDYESFGNVIAESLICGTPVVSTDCPSGPREILVGKLSKWLVPTDCDVSLAEKIQEALDTHIGIPPDLTERFSDRHFLEQILPLIQKT